ncbi:twitching motility protein PilT [Spiribacter sp. SSL99]|uniref:antitoxin n=1 Tax=Spiribacter sp. SSL99 TaxID=1866884 RepID=UPI001330F6D7|nr:AbrB/MazE/SpoVT family DNA-binding domain-containing protein [Spiribacter sp. SSL99]KAF0285082.1 twitching motility protein PilT [Spiribacter sp. SSL99]
MTIERHVRLFRNGANQAIRIPKEFELEGREAILRKEGDHLIIEPVTKKGLIDVLTELEDLEMEFPDVDERLPAAEDVTL